MTFFKIKIDKKKLKEIDKLMILVILLIALFGMLNVYIATKSTYGYSYVIKQILFFIFALIGMYIVIVVDYAKIKSFSKIFYFLSVLSLVLVLFLGIEVNGSKGWFKIGPISLQPAEFAKIATIMLMGIKLEELEGNINTIKNFFAVGIYAIIPAALIVIQPDMGMTTVLFFMVLGIYFIAGLDKKIIIGGITAILLGIVILLNTGILEDYQISRITSFLNPETDTSSSGYHLRQSLIAIGSGGLWGSQDGLSVDDTSGYAAEYVPEVETDFIFAQIAQQWGTIGASILIILYAILLWRMISIAKNAKDWFGKAVSTAMVTYFMYAIFQNIGMTIGLMPITGITLPLVSYGGSSLLTTMVSLGLIINIGTKKNKITF